MTMRALAMLLTLTGLAIASGCGTVPRTRTLPTSIQSVYVPMAVNRSSEPQIEEDLTRYVQEELLADGRLDLVQRGRANAHIEVKITQFLRETFGTDGDDLPVTMRYRVRGELQVRENIADRPPIGGAREVTASVIVNGDPRTTTYEPEPRQIEQALRAFAREVVREAITGEYQP
ncbi:MAG: LPS assembly lipoprotein LptE [Candidatus Sumerlaeia bacterium]|nr:LPS assembly lipoprotein LptE [Candidatus Sumerlaeia bacterium]